MEDHSRIESLNLARAALRGGSGNKKGSPRAPFLIAPGISQKCGCMIRR